MAMAMVESCVPFAPDPVLPAEPVLPAAALVAGLPPLLDRVLVPEADGVAGDVELEVELE